MLWCVQTGQWGWAAAPPSRSWCSDWRSSSAHAIAWTSPVLASPAVYLGPPLHSQRMCERRLWPALHQTSSLFWERGERTQGLMCTQKTGLNYLYLMEYCLQSTATIQNDMCLPGVEWVSEDVQTAHHHCWVTSCERKIYCKYGKRFKAKRHTSIQTEANLTKERNPVSDKSCQLTEQAGKERRKEQNWTKGQDRTKTGWRKAKEKGRNKREAYYSLKENFLLREDILICQKTRTCKMCVGNKNGKMDVIMYCYCRVPGDHLLLFVGGTATAAQVLVGRGQEVETVVLKGLIRQWEQHLERGNAAVRSQPQQKLYSV